MTFSEEVPKWSGKLAIIFAQYGLPDSPILSVVSNLVSGLLFFQLILSGGSCVLLFVFLVPYFLGGYLKHLFRMLRNCKRCPWKSFPRLLVSFLCNNKGLHRLFSLLYDRLSFAAIFPHSTRRRDLNIGNRRVC